VGSLREAVNALKFRGRTRLAAPLGHLLSTVVQRDAGDLRAISTNRLTDIVPVPLHASRRRDRGFDQAELLAVELGRAIDLPVRTGLIARTRSTRPQVGLSPAARAENVRGAFALQHALPSRDRRLLLVDDVYTTGATLRACARALRKGNAEAVYAVTVSRAAPAWHPAADLIGDV
jgi:ComF family protein